MSGRKNIRNGLAWLVIWRFQSVIVMYCTGHCLMQSSGSKGHRLFTSSWIKSQAVKFPRTCYSNLLHRSRVSGSTSRSPTTSPNKVNQMEDKGSK